MRLLINAGITKVIAKQLYKDFYDVLSMKDVDVSYCPTPEKFYELTYKRKK